jgi:hypothetical protein
MSSNEGIGFGAYGRSTHAIADCLLPGFQHLDKKDSDSNNLQSGTHKSPH